MLDAISKDFGELAFSEKSEKLGKETKEILAAGWRNIHNIARILASRKISREKVISAYTSNESEEIR